MTKNELGEILCDTGMMCDNDCYNANACVLLLSKAAKKEKAKKTVTSFVIGFKNEKNDDFLTTHVPP